MKSHLGIPGGFLAATGIGSGNWEFLWERHAPCQIPPTRARTHTQVLFVMLLHYLLNCYRSPVSLFNGHSHSLPVIEMGSVSELRAPCAVRGLIRGRECNDDYLGFVGQVAVKSHLLMAI